MPVEILGMNSTAFAGAEFQVTNNENEAKEMSGYKKDNSAKNKILAKDKATLFEQVKEKDELNIIIKSDVQGSSEALKCQLIKLITRKLKQKSYFQTLE